MEIHGNENIYFVVTINVSPNDYYDYDKSMELDIVAGKPIQNLSTEEKADLIRTIFASECAASEGKNILDAVGDHWWQNHLKNSKMYIRELKTKTDGLYKVSKSLSKVDGNTLFFVVGDQVHYGQTPIPLSTIGADDLRNISYGQRLFVEVNPEAFLSGDDLKRYKEHKKEAEAKEKKKKAAAAKRRKALEAKRKEKELEKVEEAKKLLAKHGIEITDDGHVQEMQK